MMKIVCAYKSGGWCSFQDVLDLKKQCHSFCTNFICYTNTEGVNYRVANRNDIILNAMPIMGFPGWWSKICCFQESGLVIYLDLDTVIVSDLVSLVHELIYSSGSHIYMLEAFNPHRKWASGIMAWKGDWSWIYDDFRRSQKYYIDKYYMDQKYISDLLGTSGYIIESINDYLNVLSYKHHVRSNNNIIPAGTDIVTFHGRPRPRELQKPLTMEEEVK